MPVVGSSTLYSWLLYIANRAMLAPTVLHATVLRALGPFVLGAAAP